MLLPFNKNPRALPRLHDFLLRHHAAIPVILSIVSLYFFSYFQRIGVPGMIFDELQIDLGLTASGVALLGATYLYIYGGMQFFVGIISDRYGFARVFLAGSIAMALGSILFPLCHAIPLLYAARALIGFGSSLLFICMAKAIDHFFAPRYFAIILSIAQFLGFSGGLAATYPLAALTHALGWRKSLLLAGVITAGLTCGLGWILRHRKLLEPQPATPVVKHLIKQVVRLRELWKLTLAGSITFAIYFVAQATIGKKLLGDCFGLRSEESSGFMFVMLLVSMVVTLLAGFILRFFRQKYRPLLLTGWLFVTLSCTGMTIALSPGLHSLTLVKLCYLGLATASFVGPIYTTVVSMTCAPKALGTAIGLMNGTLYVIISLLANGSGLILDFYQSDAVRTPGAWIYPATAYRLIFMVCTGLCLIALPALLWLRKTAGHAR
ncbi:MAG: MFS transporter [bacterium]